MDSDLFGTLTTYQEPARNDTVAVGLSSVTVSVARQAGARRKSYFIRNISTNSADIITISFGATPAVANAGIVLKQNEGFTDSSDSGYESWQGTITAICATANGQLSIFER